MTTIPESAFLSFANRLGILRRATSFSSIRGGKVCIKTYYINTLGRASALAQRLIEEDTKLLNFWYEECGGLGTNVDENKFEVEVRRVVGVQVKTEAKKEFVLKTIPRELSRFERDMM
jgi:hypothetical protein